MKSSATNGRALMALLLLFLPVSAIAERVVESGLQRDTLAIAADLRCAVCQNQSVAESQSDLARNMRLVIEEIAAADAMIRLGTPRSAPVIS